MKEYEEIDFQSGGEEDEYEEEIFEDTQDEEGLDIEENDSDQDLENDDDTYDPTEEEELGEEEFGEEEEELEEEEEEEIIVEKKKNCVLSGPISVYEDEKHHEASKQSIKIPDEERYDCPFLTRYEMVRLLGTRARQIELGGPVLIKLPANHSLSPYQIAKAELDVQASPIIITRPMPGGMYEEWKIEELTNHTVVDDQLFNYEGHFERL